MLSTGHEAIALRRSKSNLTRCHDFHNNVLWLDHDASDWSKRAIAENPEAVIHAAWSGVSAPEREDWKLQSANLVLFSELLAIAAQLNLKQFIALGSQAEYGDIKGRTGEDHPCRPTSAYGAAKLACLALLESFARQRDVSYVWLRLFSIYGPGENENWFIPNLIRQMQRGHSPRLTGCDQHYDYLHVGDLAEALLAVLGHRDVSGIFNLTSNSSVPLKAIVEHIKEFTACRAEPAYGALPYRAGLSMHMEGDSSRFHEAFKFHPKITIADGLRQLVKESTR